jgi:hypothetical protein
MGRLGAEAMNEVVNEGGTTLRQAISWHLSGNHYPPVPQYMVQVCLDAIDLANEGNYDEQVTLPEGTLWRGNATAPVHAIVENFHLDAFLDEREDW